MRSHTLQELVWQLPRFGDRPAVGLRQTFGLRWWSYRRLYTESVRVAGWLRARGLPPGAHLILWAPNGPEWVSWLLGAAMRGVVVVPADENASPELVQRLAQTVGAALLVHGPQQDAAALELPAQLLYDIGAKTAPRTSLEKGSGRPSSSRISASSIFV